MSVTPGGDLGKIYEVWRTDIEKVGRFMPTSSHHVAALNVTDFHSAGYYNGWNTSSSDHYGFCWHNLLAYTVHGTVAIVRYDPDTGNPVYRTNPRMPKLCGCEPDAGEWYWDNHNSARDALCRAGTTTWVAERMRNEFGGGGEGDYDAFFGYNTLQNSFLPGHGKPGAPNWTNYKGGMAYFGEHGNLDYQYPITKGLWSFSGGGSSWVDDAVMHAHVQQLDSTYKRYYRGVFETYWTSGGGLPTPQTGWNASAGNAPAGAGITAASRAQYEFAQREPQREYEMPAGPPVVFGGDPNVGSVEVTKFDPNTKGRVLRSMKGMNAATNNPRQGESAGQVRPQRKNPDGENLGAGLPGPFGDEDF
jgi:hypothetical protein